MPSIKDTVTQLQSLRDELTNRIKAIDADIHHKKEPVEKDSAEQVTQRENDDVLTAINSETQQTLRLIENALARIKDGSYGICAQCGGNIPRARLEALPYVTTCMNCAE